jgi:hypothetical protein
MRPSLGQRGRKLRVKEEVCVLTLLCMLLLILRQVRPSLRRWGRKLRLTEAADFRHASIAPLKVPLEEHAATYVLLLACRMV